MCVYPVAVHVRGEVVGGAGKQLNPVEQAGVPVHATPGQTSLPLALQQQTSLIPAELQLLFAPLTRQLFD